MTCSPKDFAEFCVQHRVSFSDAVRFMRSVLPAQQIEKAAELARVAYNQFGGGGTCNPAGDTKLPKSARFLTA